MHSDWAVASGDKEIEMKDTMCLRDLKEKGFTDKLIRELLPEPELKTNPYNDYYPPMKIWKTSDVEKAMEKSAFLEKQRKRRLKKLEGSD